MSSNLEPLFEPFASGTLSLPNRIVMAPMTRSRALGPLEHGMTDDMVRQIEDALDVLLFDRSADFQSKLQETPVNLARLHWESRDFMQAMASGNHAQFFDNASRALGPDARKEVEVVARGRAGGARRGSHTSRAPFR